MNSPNQPRPVPAKQKAPLVTICIGFACELKYNKTRVLRTLTLATDSRISSGLDIVNDAKKIVGVKFRNGAAIVAKAGSKMSADRFEEIFSEKAAGVEITSYRTIPNLAEDAIRELQRELLDRHIGDLAQRIRDYHCEFIIGFYFNQIPFLYTLDLHGRTATRSEKQFIAIGHGAVLADFLLTDLGFDSLNGLSALEAGFSVVEMCKIHDASCGGPCQVGNILASSPCDFEIIPYVDLDEIHPITSPPSAFHTSLLKRFATNFKPAFKLKLK